MNERAYLFSRVGPFGLLFPVAQVARVWDVRSADIRSADGRGRIDDGGAVIDLRRLFGLDTTQAGPRVSLNAYDGKTDIVVVDQVTSLYMLADKDFQPLPSALQYARTMFDAVSADPVEGVFGLRLRRTPRFVEITGWAPAGQLE
jgi:hypothetical protein